MLNSAVTLFRGVAEMHTVSEAFWITHNILFLFLTRKANYVYDNCDATWGCQAATFNRVGIHQCNPRG